MATSVHLFLHPFSCRAWICVWQENRQKESSFTSSHLLALQIFPDDHRILWDAEVEAWFRKTSQRTPPAFCVTLLNTALFYIFSSVRLKQLYMLSRLLFPLESKKLEIEGSRFSWQIKTPNEHFFRIFTHDSPICIPHSTFTEGATSLI